VNSALLAKLIEAGTPAELVAEVAVELGRAQAEHNLVERQREQNRERQRRFRSERDVTQHNVTERDERDPSPLKVSPQTPLPKTPNQCSPLNPPKLRVDYQRFGEAWNAMARVHRLPTVQRLAGKRLKAVMARYAEHGEQALFSAINMVPNCPHWMGANGWTGNFDSLMRPDNFQRMVEGVYADKQAVARIVDNDTVAANKRATADLYDRMGRTQEAEALRREAAELERQAA
jgi:hypothetical protein